MGNARARDRRAGIRREGPVERAKIDVAQERARERRRDSRRWLPVRRASPWRRDPVRRQMRTMLMA